MEGPPKKKENLDTGQRWRRAINATILNSRSTLETTHDSPMPISASSSIRPSGAPLSSENIRPSEPPRQRSSSGSEVYEAPILRALDMPMPPKKVGSGKKKPSGGSGKKPPAGVTSNPLLPVKIAPKPPTNAAALNFQSSTVKLLAKFSPEATPAASSSTWTLSDGQTTRSWTVFSTDSAAYSARPPLPGSATARKIMGNEQSKQDFVESEDEDNEIPTKKVNPSKQTNQRDKLPETTLREYKSPYASPPKNSASASTVKSALAAVPARGRSPLKRKASSELPQDSATRPRPEKPKQDSQEQIDKPQKGDQVGAAGPSSTTTTTNAAISGLQPNQILDLSGTLPEKPTLPPKQSESAPPAASKPSPSSTAPSSRRPASTTNADAIEGVQYNKISAPLSTTADKSTSPQKHPELTPPAISRPSASTKAALPLRVPSTTTSSVMEGVQSDQDVALSGTISKELAPPQKQSKSASPAISKPSPPTMAPQTVLVPDLISAGMSPDTFIRFLEMWKSMDGASQLKAFKSQIAETKDSSLKGELEGLKVYKPAEKKLASDDKDGATGEDAVDDTTSFIPGFKKPKRIQEMSREKLEQLEAKKAAERAEKQKQLDDEEPIWDISLVNGTRITKYKEYHVIYRNGHQEWVIPDDFSNHVEARALLERLAKVASVNMDERDWMSTSEKRCRGRPRKYPNNAGDRDQNATNANVVDLSRDSS